VRGSRIKGGEWEDQKVSLSISETTHGGSKFRSRYS